MKTARYLKFYIILFFSLILFACSNSAESTSKEAKDALDSIADSHGELLNQRTFEVTTAGDTINIKDQYGLKQGIWVNNTGVLLSGGVYKKDTTYYKDGQIVNK